MLFVYCSVYVADSYSSDFLTFLFLLLTVDLRLLGRQASGVSSMLSEHCGSQVPQFLTHTLMILWFLSALINLGSWAAPLGRSTQPL